MSAPVTPSTAALPGPLAARYRVDPVTAGDAAAVYRLVCDCDTAVLGHPDWSLEDVESDIGPLAGGAERAQVLVRDRGTGRVVAWWWTDPREGRAAFSADVYTEVTLPEPDGDALAGAGWAAVEGWARRWAAERGVGGTFLDVGSLHGDTAVERRLTAAGFDQVRTFWRMSGDVPRESTAAPAVPGLDIAPATDTALVHTLYEASFAGHWGHEPDSHDAWLERTRRRPGPRPVAVVGGPHRRRARGAAPGHPADAAGGRAVRRHRWAPSRRTVGGGWPPPCCTTRSRWPGARGWRRCGWGWTATTRPARRRSTGAPGWRCCSRCTPGART